MRMAVYIVVFTMRIRVSCVLAIDLSRYNSSATVLPRATRSQVSEVLVSVHWSSDPLPIESSRDIACGQTRKQRYKNFDIRVLF